METLPAQQVLLSNQEKINLRDISLPLVLYFYPKDDTPGCTQESKDFAAAYAEFQKLQVTILGVSRDTCQSHCKFKEKYQLPFELIADTEAQLCHAFDVIKEKNMYGKKVYGIERSTFIFDKEAHLVQAWRKVKVENHVIEVLTWLKTYCTAR